MSDELTIIQNQVLAINTSMTVGEVMMVGNDVDFLLQHLKEIKKQHTEAVIEWIKVNGEFMVGDNLYKIGKTKTVKCLNLAKTVEAVLNACGGDFAEFVQVLSSGAFKPAATANVLGDDAEQHFLTTWKDKIELKKIPTNLISQTQKDTTK